VSVVGFDGIDTLVIYGGKTTWLSIPKHMRTVDPETTRTDEVFQQSNISDGYTQLDLVYNKINTDYTNEPVYAKWGFSTPPIWQYIPDNFMEYINSTRGYKLNLQPNTQKELYLRGSIESVSTTFKLYCHEENWSGYFLTQKQNVFDALADFIDDIYYVKGQNYTCYRYHYPVSQNCNTKSTTDYPPGTWICDHKPEIKYGDMIIIIPDKDINNFHWAIPEQPGEMMERPQANYYVYNENPNYSAIVVELDTTQANPVEIGAFINDTCIGSTGVYPDDSVVVVRAYLNGQPEDSVTFEEHYASRSTENRKVSDYFMLDPYTYQAKKTSIKVGDRKQAYIVSFRNKKAEDTKLLNNTFFEIYPNPAYDIINYQLIVSKPGNVKIELLNITGLVQVKILDDNKESGIYTGQWNINKLSGYNLKAGIYFIKVTTQAGTTVKKVLIQ